MGIFGESKQDRLIRYIETLKEVVSEHDRTYHGQVKKIHEDYNTISPEEFDPNINLEEFYISPVGLFKYRLLGACMVVIKFMQKKGDHDEFLQFASGLCNAVDLDDLDSGGLINNKPDPAGNKSDLAKVYDSVVLDYTRNLSEKNLFEISKLHLEALGESVGEEFISSKINHNALRINSLSVSELMTNFMHTDLK